MLKKTKPDVCDAVKVATRVLVDPQSKVWPLKSSEVYGNYLTPGLAAKMRLLASSRACFVLLALQTTGAPTG